MILSSIFNFDLENEILKVGIFRIPLQSLIDFSQHILNSIFVILIMYLTVKIGWKVLDKWAEKQGSLRLSFDENMSKTIAVILKSVLRYFVYFIGGITIFTNFFGTISFTLAGIGGVALGFGAQSIVKDVITGFFILFEGQYVVGDHIEIDNKSGIVESIELRVTRIRDFNGALHIIPNGSITKVTNHSKGPKRIQVDINISYEEDIDKTIKVITNSCEKFSKDNDNIEEKPKVVGITELGASGVNIRVVGKVKPLTQWGQENELRRIIKLDLDESNIEIPYAKANIISDKNSNQ